MKVFKPYRARLAFVGLLSAPCFAFAAAIAGSPSKVTRSDSTDADLLISGGTVYTGDLSPGRVMDVGIKGDKIVFVGSAKAHNVQGARTIDARGMIVIPGIIDSHSHIDDQLSSDDPAERRVSRQLLQGVTTSILGVDGRGTSDVSGQVARFERAGVGQNFATYVGFGTVRSEVIGERSEPPGAEELARMKQLAATAMCEGALGVSTSLFYAPQNFASTEEIIAVAKEAGQRGGLYDTHQRDEGNSTIGIVASMKEALRIGEESGATLHVAHLKVTGGWSAGGEPMTEVIRLVDTARAQGHEVTADQYPWTAASTSLAGAVIPPWAHEGGDDAMLKRFDDPADLQRLRDGAGTMRAAASRLMINYAPDYPEIVGKRLSDIATEWHLDPFDAAVRILKKSVDVSVAIFVMKEEDVVAAIRQPWVMLSTDGSNGGHPRGFGTYPKIWTDYVMKQNVLKPEEFVHKSSGLVADTLGLTGRGYIKPGFFADVAVINPKQYVSNATYEHPTRLASGVTALLVNGKLEVANGELTGVLAGRGLLKTPTPGTCSVAIDALNSSSPS